MHIRPFQALRPTEALVSRVAAVPYDVVDRAEASSLACASPLSFLHVSRSEIDLPTDTDPYADSVYQKAAGTFEAFQQNGTLIRDREPALYLYRLQRGPHTQRGMVVCCAVKEYEQDLIKKHEKTRRDKEDDRTRHVGTLRAHTGPVFLTYRDQPAIDRLVTAIEATAPVYDFIAEDGIGHTIWRAPDTEAIVKAFTAVPVAYIADGHHRAASAVRVAQECRRATGNDDPNAEHNWFLAVLFPANQLAILPYNRCVKDLKGLSVPDFMAAVQQAGFTISTQAPAVPTAPEQISMYVDHHWYGLSWARDPNANPVSSLDVSVLQSRLLAPVLGVFDPRTDSRIDFIGGIRGTHALEDRVNRGTAAVAFSMFPVTVDQLMAISDAGQIMPPKSTWFEPKLRDALLIHTF